MNLNLKMANLNLNFLFREPKLNSQPYPERVLLAMIKVETKNKRKF